jgi:hypothetical protein
MEKLKAPGGVTRVSEWSSGTVFVCMIRKKKEISRNVIYIVSIYGVQYYHIISRNLALVLKISQF